MRISDWSSDVCSSDLDEVPGLGPETGFTQSVCTTRHASAAYDAYLAFLENPGPVIVGAAAGASCFGPAYEFVMILDRDLRKRKLRDRVPMTRSEEHTSELQSLMRISYAVFCLKKKNKHNNSHIPK